MQRIIFRYRKEAAANALSHSELRATFLDAAEQAKLPLGDGRRVICMGPPLQPGATSDAEMAVIELMAPHDPSEVAMRMNVHLPPGIRIERAWIATPGSLEENPGTLDEAVYEVVWNDAPQTEELLARIHGFLAACEVNFTRQREKKTQCFNARALVQDLRVLASRDGLARLRMTVSVGPQGSLRPEEVLQLLGDGAASSGVRTHRVALQRSVWRHPSPAGMPRRWQRH